MTHRNSPRTRIIHCAQIKAYYCLAFLVFFSRSVSSHRSNFSLSKHAKAFENRIVFHRRSFAFHPLYPLGGVSFHYWWNDRYVREGYLLAGSNTSSLMGGLSSRIFRSCIVSRDYGRNYDWALLLVGQITAFLSVYPVLFTAYILAHFCTIFLLIYWFLQR